MSSNGTPSCLAVAIATSSLVLHPYPVMVFFIVEGGISEKGYPASLMANEAMIRLNSLTKRCDTVVYDNSLRPVVICEFKKPDIEITQQVFDQVVRYNIVLKVKYLIVSNGMSHYCCKMNYEDMSFDYLQEIPEYGDL